MAVVVKHGFKPTQSTAMYSIFDSGSQRYKSLDNQLNNSTSCDPDGVYDRSSHEPLDSSTVNSQEHSFRQDTIPSRPAPRTPSKAEGVFTGCINDGTVVIDPNNSRRKRRKVTPITNRAESKTTWSLEENSDSVNIGDDGQELSAGINLLEDATIVQPEPVSRTPKRGRPRKKQMQSGNLTTDVRDQHLSEEQTMKGSKILTPKKKTVSLHANGKLLSSPSSEPIVSKEVKTLVDIKPSSARNVRMKNGKFVQSLEIVLRYGCDAQSREFIGRKIETLLSNQRCKSHPESKGGSSKTHPFFLGKVKPKLQPADGASTQEDNTDNDNDPTSHRKEPIAWKDIKFSHQKPTVFKSIDSVPVIWPPLGFLHIGCNVLTSNVGTSTFKKLVKAKLKSTVVQLRDDENVLSLFTKQLAIESQRSDTLVNPQRRQLRGTEVAQILSEVCLTPATHVAFHTAYSNLAFGSSAFDRGVCAGPNMWPTQYLPNSASSVLQSSAVSLHKWLQNLAIHNVKSGIETSSNAKRSKNFAKKKRRRLKDELDDFIVDSEEDEVFGKSTKTAILLVGPHGCGKTASVFAVAKELGFEVFEIHPGMRRTAKDIFDKVGDMAHNHLVQKGSDVSRSSSVAPVDSEIQTTLEVGGKQNVPANLLNLKTNMRPQKRENPLPAKAKREQKQSLILFEEVDVLFEEDKGFWSGVESLIQNSKRPVVLTCNDLTSVPIEDLDLYDILTYEPVAHGLATDYLMYLAAAEGHILDRDAVSTLYTSKGNDLRASITELNFWCQMTVGSKQGGLDWMGQHNPHQSLMDNTGPKPRVFSQGTFHKSLDLLPQVDNCTEATIRFAQDFLGIAAADWCDIANVEALAFLDDAVSPMDCLTQLSEILDTRSVIDLFDDFAAPILSEITTEICHTSAIGMQRNYVTSRYQYQPTQGVLQSSDLISALEPLKVEKPTFPPAQGRLAPSMEVMSTSLVTDVAPYARCIVNFDKHLESYRDGLSGSQGKARKTRASRAAAEGSDKASTRADRWLPKDTDFDKILRTGGEWPAWYHPDDISVASPFASSEA